MAQFHKRHSSTRFTQPQNEGKCLMEDPGSAAQGTASNAYGLSAGAGCREAIPTVPNRTGCIASVRLTRADHLLLRIAALCLLFMTSSLESRGMEGGAQDPPPSPPPSEWGFVEALAAPMRWMPHWERSTKRADEVSLMRGVRIEADFPDPERLLDTAYDDLNAFFRAVNIPADGPYRVVTEQIQTSVFESFKIAVTEDMCRIQAGDTEGIRRGIYFLEDQLLAAEGPFLSLGEIDRSPYIATRISRCFFGPIKRPPKNKDELLDDVDYYPDGYLSRLAHDGVNGLWLTIEFKDLCRTSLTDVVDPNRERRLEKLRKTVAKCGRYGIKVYLFCIEPRVMDSDNPLVQAHPEIGSKPFSGSGLLFCPFSDAAQTYLYEAMNDIFTQAPNLGGLLNISFGERSTTCLSGADEEWRVACTVCEKKAPGEILRASLSAMERGMRAANPGAKLISWLYVPGNGTGSQRTTEPLRDIARLTPPGVICQYNFESDGIKEQLGKPRHAGDYWLSYIGPSDVFRSIAEGAAEAGVAIGAKLQVCNSFEVSTVPYVPVPGHLYGKYRAMRQLGVTSVMQCWYIGSLPSVMNRAAAGVLPFATDTMSEDEFLIALARREWGPSNAPHVVRAWRQFAKAYENYPLTNAFQYYGPMHDGVVWPLHLKPAHTNLSPVWKLEYPPSGDRIGECFSGTHTLDEMLTLLKSMSEGWQTGLDVLMELEPACANNPDRLMDLAVAQALGIQFSTGYNILRFYDVRERLIYDSGADRKRLLDELRAIAEEEIAHSTKMIELCERNPYLGFQAEAENYTYFPAELRWRVERLREMLRTEFAEAESALAAGKPLFPAESGQTDGPLVYRCVRGGSGFAGAWQSDASWTLVPRADASSETFSWSWQAAHDHDAIYVTVNCPPSERWRATVVSVAIESTQIYPRRTFRGDINGNRTARLGWLVPDMPWEFVTDTAGGQRAFRMKIPLATFQGETDGSRPMRINVEVTAVSPDNKESAHFSWAPSSPSPVQARLGYGGDDPAEMGWMRLERDTLSE